MSDIKRVNLTAIEPPRASEKVPKKPSKTVRISIVLPESNEDNCPEYNYKDELAAVKKKAKFSKNPDSLQNGFEPPGMDDDDVRRFAMEMEEKYGNKKKRKGKKDDYADIGMGYDESDSFIDNTDGYDEIIPQNVTTLHGGFYINSGALEFKTDDEANSDLSSSSDSDSDDEKQPKEKEKRKRILETSDEDEDPEDKKARLELNSKNSIQDAIKKKLFSQNKIKVKSRRPIDPLKKTVKELLREKRHDLNMSVQSEMGEEQVVNDGVLEASDKDALKENKKPMCISSVTDAIESVVKQTIGVSKNNLDIIDKINTEVSIKEQITKPESAPIVVTDTVETSQETANVEKMEIVKLPENLPSDILQMIDNIKKAAENNKDGKVKFFTDEVNVMLLKLERKCKCLGKPSKTKVYEHLSVFVKCKKDTLVRRAKALVLEDEQRRLKKLLGSLKHGIEKLMPSLVTEYELECQKVLEKKLSGESGQNDEKNALRLLKRRFRWNDETRKYMKEIFFTKKRCLLLEGKQKETHDEEFKTFFKNQVQTLWPDGWMSGQALKKLCTSFTESRKPDEKHSPAVAAPSSINLSQNNCNLSIIPLPSANFVKSNNNVKVDNNVANDLTVSKINNAAINVECSGTSQKETTVSQPVQSTKKETVEPRVLSNFDIKKLLLDDRKSTPPPPAPTPPQPVITDSTVIVVNTNHNNPKEETSRNHVKCEVNTVIEAPHCQVIDLTEPEPRKAKSAPKSKIKMEDPVAKPLKLVKESMESGFLTSASATSEYIDKFFREVRNDHHHIEVKRKPGPKSKTRPIDEPLNYRTTAPPNDYFTDINKLTVKHPELSVTPNYFNSNATTASTADYTNARNDGDDIQKVMENLKALQKLSSPIKSETATGSPVSVIAYNKNFSPKSSNNSNQSSTSQQTTTTQQRTDFSNKGDFTASFQDEFQKQLFSSMNQLTPTSSKTNYNRCS